MRNVLVTVGEAPVGTMVSIHCSAPSGGRSTVGHLVRDGDTPIVTASELARRITNDRQWCPGEFQAQASGSTILINCREAVSNVTIYGDPDTDYLKITDWGK